MQNISRKELGNENFIAIETRRGENYKFRFPKKFSNSFQFFYYGEITPYGGLAGLPKINIFVDT